MIYLPIFQLENSQSGLLAAHPPLSLGCFELLLVQEAVLYRGNPLVQRDVEVVVEVGAVAAHPRELPKILLLVRRDLLDRRTRDGNHCRVLVCQVSQVGEVSCHERATLTTIIGRRLEHEVVDDQLRLGAEKILQRDWAVRALEVVSLRHGHHGKGPPVGLDGVDKASALFLLFEKSKTGCTPFLSGCNLMPCQSQIVTLWGEKG